MPGSGWGLGVSRSAGLFGLERGLAEQLAVVLWFSYSAAWFLGQKLFATGSGPLQHGPYHSLLFPCNPMGALRDCQPDTLSSGLYGSVVAFCSAS